MNINNSIQILKESNIKEIIKNISDALLQSTLKDFKLLSNLPMVGMAFSVYGAINSVRDIVYLNNVLKFLIETSEITLEEREAFVMQLEKEPKNYERLCISSVALLSNFEDQRKASILGLIIKHRIKNKLTTECFLRLSFAVSKVFVDDLKNLQKFHFAKIPSSEDINLLHSGLLYNKGLGWNNSRDSEKYIDHYILNSDGNQLYYILREENFQFD